MMERSGADGVMVGRAAVGRPWIVGAIARALAAGDTGGVEPAHPPLELRRDAALEHYDSLLSAYGARVGVRHARKHLAAYADDLAREGRAVLPDLRRTLVTAEDAAQVAAALASVLKSPLMEAAA